MDLSKILAISGKGGLFKVVGQTKNGVVVESLLDGKKFPTYSSQQVSALEEISIYGEEEDIPLKDIFTRIHKVENGKQTSVSPKDSGAELREYFSDIIPEFDAERVYNSDIKKVISWYNLLLKAGLVTIEEKKPVAKKTAKVESAAEETSEDAPKKDAKKPASKKAEAKKPAEKKDTAKKPAVKKAAPKKEKK
ncbi:MAG: DUF5606 domain-containing protein [Flavobacteriales bacterium]|nr:DUF5606 domain-containing protein [Flavobacteriales bacterium]